MGRRLVWAMAALLAAGLDVLLWTRTSTLCDVDSAGHEVCRAGPVMGVPGGVLATFFLTVIVLFSLTRVFRRK
ncbi:hypothetical protein RN607_01765 [Demequina capsici]|uniref:Uncharacterized protein n=1 Tax=Demequina capsici TaxID=3075620 RepID=A0AA96FE69_9MICO|nr:hypothetical protein [Demequina sp. PMTSA13]WNM27757.1 hypothetical protein RN607_01765 [Demequina sp. PMTSA13]